MPKDRCSFEVVYAKTDGGLEEIEHVVIRGGLSDASVSLTISQVFNLARLLDLVPTHAPERTSSGVAALPPATAAPAARRPAAMNGMRGGD